MKIIILIFTFYCSSTFADFTLACFQNSRIAKNVAKDIDFLKMPEDNIQIKNECLRIETSSMRIDLYQKYLKKNHDVSFVDIIPTNNQTRENCNITIRKVLNSQASDNRLQISGKDNSASIGNNSKMINSVSQMVLTEGLSGQIAYGEENYNIICDKRRDGFEIRLTSTSNDLSIITSRFIKSGEEIELGEVLSRSQSKENSASSNQGIHLKQNQKSQMNKLYLSVK